MKKIIFTLCTFIMIIFVVNIEVLATSENGHYYNQLSNNEKIYYKALQKMEEYDYFVKNKKMNLVKEEFLNDDIFNQYAIGNYQMFNSFENAKKAFELDYPQLFYLDFEKLSLDFYIDKNNEKVVEIASGRYDNYLLEDYDFNTLAEDLKKYNTAVNDLVKEAKKANKIEDRIQYIINQTYLPKKDIKVCLDRLNVENYLLEFTGTINNEMKIDALFNIYLYENKYVELITKTAVNEFQETKEDLSKSYNYYETLTNNKVQLLESKENSPELYLFAKTVFEEKENTLFSEKIKLSFYRNNNLVKELKNSQTVLIPYPSGYTQISNQVKYNVYKLNRINEYEEIKSAKLPMGIVVEIEENTTILIDAVIESNQEELTSKELVIITSLGGSVNIPSINTVQKDKNIKFSIEASKDYFIDQILFDGKLLNYRDNEKLEMVINYEEMKPGSLIQINFIEKTQYNKDIKRIDSIDITPNVSISSKNNAVVGEQVVLTAEYNALGNVCYEWYHEGNLVGYTQTNKYIIPSMKEEDRGIYTVRAIETVGNKIYTANSEEFMLRDTVIYNDNPIIYSIVFAVIIVIIFVLYLLFDNLAIKHHKKIND